MPPSSDGVRLCKAKRYRYANSDMADLEAKLVEASDARHRLIATDGVFSMDGYIADLPAICDLAERHDAMVMVDDSHAVGFVGATGRGTPEHCGVEGRVDILTGTLGKALGGAAGGYVAARKEVVEWLRQRARPYLFSNTLAPVIAQTSLSALDLLAGSPELRERLWRNANHFRAKMTAIGFELLPGVHPIVPLMLRDPKVAQDFADGPSRQGRAGIRVFVPGGPARAGPHPHPDVGGSRSRGSGPRDCRIRGGRARPGSDRVEHLPEQPKEIQAMPLLPLIEYEDAVPEVRAVYDDIMGTRGTDWINNFWKVLANHPETLARVWGDVKTVMKPGALDPLVKEMIYVAVSATNNCEYCIHSHTAGARAKGMTDEMFAELMAVTAPCERDQPAGQRIPGAGRRCVPGLPGLRRFTGTPAPSGTGRSSIRLQFGHCPAPPRRIGDHDGGPDER